MNIAIIPARGGSTRIKNKNFKYFFGKPVISYSIATALNSKLFSEVIVSTDNEKLIYVSKIAGAKVLFKRPNYLSKNNIPVILMHMQGNPKSMQKNPFYHDVVEEISTFFKEKIRMYWYFSFKNF